MKRLLLIPIILILSLVIVTSLIGEISDNIISSFTYDASVGLKPHIITLNDNITIITHTGVGNDGFVRTINISGTNASIFNIIDTFEWDTVVGLESRIVNVNENVYAIVSQGSQGDGFIDTVNISDTGIITQAVVDSLEFDIAQAISPDIISVDSDTVAIAYGGVGNDGFLVTVDIDNSGQIGASVVDSFEFDATNGMEIDIIKIAPEIYAIAYEGVISTNGGKISTINITDDGQIGASTINDFIFDPDGLDPEILQVGTTNTFAIVYENSTGNGNIRTVNIFPNGTITAELDRQEFDAVGNDINIISVSDNSLGIVYSGTDSDGFVRTFNISDAGIISSTFVDSLEFELTQATNPIITNVVNDIYQVAFENSGTNGVTVSFNISSEAVAEIIILNTTNLNVFQSKNPVEILEEFTLFANYTNSTDGQPVLNATCFANSTTITGEPAGFGRGVLGIGGLSTLNNAVHTQVQDIFGNNTLRVDIDNLPLGKASYATNFRFHVDTALPSDNLRIFATCHNNLSFSNFTFIDQVNITEAVLSTSAGNDTIWGFKNVVLIGASVATSNCSIVFESQNSTSSAVWHIADTTTSLNLNNSFTSDNFGVNYTLRSNADSRSPFVDAGFGLDVPNETTMTFNSTSGLYFLPNIRHGRPFDFNDSVFCSADNFQNNNASVETNVQDNVAPIVQIISITPAVAIINLSNVTIEWIANDPELLTNFINVSFPDGSLLIQSENKPLVIDGLTLTVVGNYSVVVFANDTGGLSSTANGTFEVIAIDLTPPTITLVSPANNTATNVIPLNITFTVTDNTPNGITCILQNSSFEFDRGNFIQGVNSNLTLAEGSTVLSQAFPNLNLTCFDNSPQNNSASLVLNYTLDTVPPIITIVAPANLSRFNRDIVNTVQLQATCADAPVFRFNITVSNTTDTVLSVEDRNPVANVITIDTPLNIQNLGVGNYTVTYECADTHTSREIKDYTITKRRDADGTTVKFKTSDNNIDIAYLNDKSGIYAVRYGATKSKENDRYYFNFDMNETKGVERTYTFEVKSEQEVTYISNSKYKAHFITGDNWIDFEFGDKDADYSISKNQNGNYEVAITTKKTDLNFNSIGDLNIVTIQTQIEIFFIEHIQDLFQVTECRTDTGSVLLLSLFFLIAFGLIFAGITTKIGFIGFFGAIMLWITSWFIVACVAIIATLITLLSMVFLFFFIFRGVFPNMFSPR